MSNLKKGKSMRELGFWFLCGLMILGLMLIGSIGYYFAQPYFIARETQTIRHSNPYVTSKKQAIATMESDLAALETRKQFFLHQDVSREVIESLDAQIAGIRQQINQERVILFDR